MEWGKWKKRGEYWPMDPPWPRVTERDAIEQDHMRELRRLEEELRRQYTQASQLSYTISHEHLVHLFRAMPKEGLVALLQALVALRLDGIELDPWLEQFLTRLTKDVVQPQEEVT